MPPARRRPAQPARPPDRSATSPRRRLEVELLRRGLVADPTEAAEVVAAGRVLVAGSVATNPSRQVDPAEAVTVRAAPPLFVSRGGHKLAAALDRFGIDVEGATVLDAGASTGGFSDCVLQRGAAHVVAVDVGYGQLHDRVARDPRVDVIDRTHIRDLDATRLPVVDLVVADLSFISLTRVVDPLIAPDPADLVVLVKPQFEAPKADADRGRGVITDPAVWHRTLAEVIAAFGRAGATIMGLMVSPITGSGGNTEFLAHFRFTSRTEATGDAGHSSDRTRLIDAAVDEAVAAAALRTR